MIGTLLEGVTQSVLPCSWTVLVPAFAVGMSTRSWASVAWFGASLWVSSWVVASGFLPAPALWVSGAVLVAGALLYWVLPVGVATVPGVVLIGMGTAWAWRPCVGPALGEVLNTALRDPVSALVGLAVFLLGLAGTGMVLGRGLARLFGHDVRRPAALAVAAIGLTMLLGVYPAVSSTLARWSVALWA